MTMDLEIDTSEVDAFVARFGPAAQAIAAMETERAMRESVQLVETLVKGETPVASGQTRGSVTHEVYGVPLGEYAGRVFSDLPHIEPLEYGASPHWAPIDPLKLWAARVLGDENAAYAVRAAIAQRGTYGAHMFARAFLEAEPRVQAIWALVPGRIVSQWEAI
jgi:hypothetical protein